MTTSSNQLPRRFGRYALFDFIGKGGMAEIYLARAETELGASRLCVVKEILPELADDADFAEMLVFEAKLAARLNHVNIVQVFDLGRTEGRLFIAMEYVEGYDLNALLRLVSRKKEPFLLEHALHIVSCVLRGLSFAHRAKADDGQELGIVHRDVSPSNVLISLDGEVKLCDFGIAKANDRLGARKGELGEALRGKAGYMSPEHARGEDIDARADVFAVGILLWELLSGRRMYRATEQANLLEVAQRAEVPELAVRAEVPKLARLHGIVTRALSVDRTQRFESAAAMSRELDDYLAEAEIATNPLQFGSWLRERVGSEELDERRERERVLTPHAEVSVAPFSSLVDPQELDGELPPGFVSLIGDDPVEPAVMAAPSVPAAAVIEAVVVAGAEPVVNEVVTSEPVESAPVEEGAAGGAVEGVEPEVAAAAVEAEPLAPVDPDRLEVPLRPSHIPVPSIGAMRTFVRELQEVEEPTPPPLPQPPSLPPPSRGNRVILLALFLIAVTCLVLAFFWR